MAQWGQYVPSTVSNIVQLEHSKGSIGDAVVYPQITITNTNSDKPPCAQLQRQRSRITTDGPIGGRFNKGRRVNSGAIVPESSENGCQATASVNVRGIIYDSQQSVLAFSSVSGVVVQSGQEVTVKLPQLNLTQTPLWGVLQPNLLTFETILTDDSGAVLDSLNTTFGLRSIRWDKEDGFFLNDVPTKIKGMANHQDFCGVGVAVPDSLQEYRVKTLLEMGANGWRTAHNPPTIALLDECDRQGMLVWDENHRNLAVGEAWLSDLKSLVMRDRNHPSVIMWSLCNEVLCENFNATSAQILRSIVKALDPLGDRPVTAAMNGGYETQFWKALDVVGINYHVSSYDAFDKVFSRPLIGSETSSALSDRGQYVTDASLAYVSAYDVNCPSWGNTAEDAWCPIAQRKFVSGGFVWTGYDYKGEPTPYEWPNINSHFGVIDICGFEKDTAMYYRSVWRSDAQLHVYPHWTWTSDCAPPCRDTNAGTRVVEVWAYTNADSVELLLNGASLGVKSVPSSACEHVAWNVTYQPGVLEARSYKQGSDTPVLVKQITTAKEPHQILVTSDFQNTPFRANGQDVILLRATIVDESLVVVPTASIGLSITVTGPAKIIGLGNGDPSSHEPDKPARENFGQRSTWHGLARVVLQSTGAKGEVVVTIADSAEGSQLVSGIFKVSSV